MPRMKTKLSPALLLLLPFCVFDQADAQPYTGLRMQSPQRDFASDEMGDHPGVYMNGANRAQPGAVADGTAVTFDGEAQ